MVTFRNNNSRRNNFRRGERNFKSNNDRGKFGTNFSNNENFQRKIPGRNNHNASKLIDKYNNLLQSGWSLDYDEVSRDIQKIFYGSYESFMDKEILL